MAKIIFISGGARSGKSRLAERIAEGFGAPLCYIATALAGDGEMAGRIAAHRARRGEKWHTVEEPIALLEAVRAADGRYRAVLVDCVTLWLTNLLLAHEDADRALLEVRELAGLLAESTTPCILVSNEVGMGIVPDNTLARTFRDLAGRANEALAAAADEAYVTISGIPLRLK